MGCVAVVLVIRNMRLGRGDRRGAIRIALAIGACAFLPGLFSLSYSGGGWSFPRFQLILAFTLLSAAFAWAFYMALEPVVRRWWPSTLISWSRLLSGRVRDPLVGRDILVGVIFGLIYQLGNCVDRSMGSWLGIAPPRLMLFRYPADDFLGFGRMIAFFAGQVVVWLLMFMGVLLALAVMRAILRKRWLAVAVVFPILFVWDIGALSEPVWLSVIMNLVVTAVIMFVLLRFGLLATIVGAATYVLTGLYPLTTDFSLWYANATIYACAGVLVLAAYGFLVSMSRGRRGLASTAPPVL